MFLRSVIVLVVIVGIGGSPVRFLSGALLGGLGGFDEDQDQYEDYDLYYDQRQNGTLNFRTNLDGFAFVVPVDKTMTSNAAAAVGNIALELLSGGLSHNSDHLEDGDYYDQEISQSPYVEHIVKPEKPTYQESQEITDTPFQGIPLEITPPPPAAAASSTSKEEAAEENEINSAATTAEEEITTRKNEKRRFKDVHRRNKHPRPYFRPFLNRLFTRLIPA
ncbi:hypothetical protein DMENIID0001_106960 [Sergentomyia squamirostris]